MDVLEILLTIVFLTVLAKLCSWFADVVEREQTRDGCLDQLLLDHYREEQEPDQPTLGHGEGDHETSNASTTVGTQTDVPGILDAATQTESQPSCVDHPTGELDSLRRITADLIEDKSIQAEQVGELRWQCNAGSRHGTKLAMRLEASEKIRRELEKRIEQQHGRVSWVNKRLLEFELESRSSNNVKVPMQDAAVQTDDVVPTLAAHSRRALAVASQQQAAKPIIRLRKVHVGIQTDGPYPDNAQDARRSAEEQRDAALEQIRQMEDKLFEAEDEEARAWTKVKTLERELEATRERLQAQDGCPAKLRDAQDARRSAEDQRDTALKQIRQMEDKLFDAEDEEARAWTKAKALERELDATRERLQAQDGCPEKLRDAEQQAFNAALESSETEAARYNLAAKLAEKNETLKDALYELEDVKRRLRQVVQANERAAENAEATTQSNNVTQGQFDDVVQQRQQMLMERDRAISELATIRSQAAAAESLYANMLADGQGLFAELQTERQKVEALQRALATTAKELQAARGWDGDTQPAEAPPTHLQPHGVQPVNTQPANIETIISQDPNNGTFESTNAADAENGMDMELNDTGVQAPQFTFSPIAEVPAIAPTTQEPAAPIFGMDMEVNNTDVQAPQFTFGPIAEVPAIAVPTQEPAAPMFQGAFVRGEPAAPTFPAVVQAAVVNGPTERSNPSVATTPSEQTAPENGLPRIQSTEPAGQQQPQPGGTGLEWGDTLPGMLPESTAQNGISEEENAEMERLIQETFDKDLVAETQRPAQPQNVPAPAIAPAFPAQQGQRLLTIAESSSNTIEPRIGNAEQGRRGRRKERDVAKPPPAQGARKIAVPKSLRAKRPKSPEGDITIRDCRKCKNQYPGNDNQCPFCALQPDFFDPRSDSDQGL